MRNQYYFIVFSCLFFGFSFSANSATISVVNKGSGNDVLEISGVIIKGDYKNLKRLLLSKRDNFVAFQRLVYLNSTGGDVDEALKIGSLIKKNFSYTVVADGEVCFSSCFLIWAGGASRIFMDTAKLGIHRLALNSKEISVNKTEKMTAPISRKVDVYLKDNGIPQKVIDRMNETTPSDIFVITTNWLIKEDLVSSMEEQKSFIEVVEKECGPNAWVVFKRTGKDPGEEFSKSWSACKNEVLIKNQDMVERDVYDILRSNK